MPAKPPIREMFRPSWYAIYLSLLSVASRCLLGDVLYGFEFILSPAAVDEIAD